MADVILDLLLRKYDDVYTIGSGSFGNVYDCREQTGTRVAVKASIDPHGRELAMREAEHMAIIPPHVNVLPLISFKSIPEATLLAAPLATGGDSLKMMLQRNLAPLPEDDLRQLFEQLMAGLRHIHKAGVVHRDIKCENLLLTGPRRRTLVIADFGFASKWCKTMKLTESWGSLHYSAPEICDSLPYVGPEVDVWSSGVVLYAWATGRLPFGGATKAHTSELVRNASYTVPNSVSPPLADLIRGILNADVTARLTIEQITQHPWMTAPPTSPNPAVPRHTSADSFARRGSTVPIVLLQEQPADVDNQHRRSSTGDGTQPTRLRRVVTVVKNAFLRNGSPKD